MKKTVPTPTAQGSARARATRAKIYAAAIALIDEKGFEATTMEQIAAAAGVVRASVFNHFAAKHDVLAAFLREFTNEIIAKAKVSAARGFRGRLQVLFAAAGAVARRHRNVIAATASLAVGHGPLAPVDGEVDDVLRSFLADLVKDAQRGGEVRADLKADFLANLILGLMTVTLHDWVNGGTTRALDEELNARLDALLGGVAATASPTAKRGPKRR